MRIDPAWDGASVQSDVNGKRRTPLEDRYTQDSWLRRVLGSIHNSLFHVGAHEQLRRAVGHAELSDISSGSSLYSSRATVASTSGALKFTSERYLIPCVQELYAIVDLDSLRNTTIIHLP
jgi:hypothetical protein